ncbi:MAG: S1 RNA-binding domain-containing protein [Chloroflexi bacterium]|nr:S1 RNA-binding domain-containing protein [Chloroflexota bacterium]
MSEETTEMVVEAAAPTSIDDINPKMKLAGTVKRLELYGAFLDVGVGANALVHISKLGKERVNRVSDVLNVGDEVVVWVEKINPNNQQIMVSMIEPLAVEWADLKKGQAYTGRVNRLENFGAFVDIGAEREGLVHISELSHDYVKHPSEAYSVGDEVQVQVLGFSKRKRRIDLSVKALLNAPQKEESYGGYQGKSQQDDYSYDDEDEFEDETMPTAMEIAMRRAMGEPVPSPTRGRKRKRRRSRARMRAQQEDIMNRTLRVRHDG